jgi:hypothetical protein
VYGTGRDAILVDLQPSLRDFSMVHGNPGLRPGLSSTVPTGLDLVMISRRHKSPRQLGFLGGRTLQRSKFLRSKLEIGDGGRRWL